MSLLLDYYAALVASKRGPSLGPDIAYNGATMLQASEVVMPAETGLEWGTDSYTMEFWARCTGNSSAGYIQGQDDATNRVLSLMPIGGELYFDSGNDGVGRLSCGWPDNFPNRLIHYALQVDVAANQMRLYVDGNLFAQKSGYALRYAVLNTLRFLGTAVQFGEIRYWNYVRSQAQIRELMNKSIGGPHAGLLYAWRCDERGAAGTEVYDRSGNDYHGVIV